MKKSVYAGTYTGTGSKGIYSFTFDQGQLGSPVLFAEIKNPKYLVKTKGGILSVCDFDGRSGVAFFGQKGQLISKTAYEERTSCYIAEHDGKVYTANYHLGTFTVLKKNEGNLKFIRTVTIREGAGCHQVLFWNDQILVPCLFLDRVVIFDTELNRIGSIKFDHGTGPRHGVFTNDRQYLYLVSELSNELFVIHTGDWKILQEISVLPDQEKNVRGTAAIRMNEAEDKIYVSTRGKDLISVIDVKDHQAKLIQSVPCGGKHPRDFILMDGYLLCADRYSNQVVSFEIKEDGTIGDKVSEISIPEPVSLVR